MAVYEANIRSLAEFISDTKLGFMPCDVSSTKGRRRKGDSCYMITAYDIHCDRIYVVNDCFIDTEENIVVTSYIPSINYCLITKELSACYNRGTHLSFEYKTDSKVLKYKVGKDIELNSYDDFETCMENLIRYIGQNIEIMVNDFKYGEWTIEGVVYDIAWQVDKIKK